MKQLTIVILGLLATSVVGQTTDIETSLDRIENQMQSSHLIEREKALTDLCKLTIAAIQPHGIECPTAVERLVVHRPGLTDHIAVSLANLLNMENATFQSENSSPGTYTEDDREYYASLIDIVSALSDDRLIGPLAGAIETGGVAEQGLVKYGRKALDPLLRQLRSSSNPMLRSESLAMSVTLLLSEPDGSSRGRLTGIIESGLQDREFLVRMAAIQSIERINDGTPFVPQLQNLMENDPVKIEARDRGGNENYPVRREADRALQKIIKQEGPKAGVAR